MTLIGEDPQTYAKAALEVRILRLRQKLLRVGADPDCLKALRGYGYQLGPTIGVR
jgi:DNA-binding response OmpR family regulator